jgi:hypothetical protein
MPNFLLLQLWGVAKIAKRQLSQAVPIMIRAGSQHRAVLQSALR